MMITEHFHWQHSLHCQPALKMPSFWTFFSLQRVSFLQIHQFFFPYTKNSSHTVKIFQIDATPICHSLDVWLLAQIVFVFSTRNTRTLRTLENKRKKKYAKSQFQRNVSSLVLFHRYTNSSYRFDAVALLRASHCCGARVSFSLFSLGARRAVCLCACVDSIFFLFFSGWPLPLPLCACLRWRMYARSWLHCDTSWEWKKKFGLNELCKPAKCNTPP